MEQTMFLDWEIHQLVRAGLFADEHAVIRSALRSLFHARPEIRREMLIHAYISGEISMGRAAEMMGVSHEEMKDILTESGAEIHLGPRTVTELHQDIANA